MKEGHLNNEDLSLAEEFGRDIIKINSNYSWRVNLMTLLTNILSSIIVIGFGVVLKLWPPGEINSMYGYRTFFAMKNRETWKEANSFSSVMMIVSGLITLNFSLLVTFLFKTDSDTSNTISVAGTMVIVLCFVLYTEIHLRKIFDKNGIRKVNEKK